MNAGQIAIARVAPLIVLSGVTLLAMACGGGAPSGSPGTSSGRLTSSRQLAFSQCMRTHGVTNFPDPNSHGQIPKETSRQLGVTSSRLQAAQSACEGLLPPSQPTPTMQQRVLAQSVRFSQCMRAHGVTNLPDPGSDGRIPDPASVGIDQSSPQFEAANQACGRYRPPYIPSNAAYNSWATTHGS